MPNNERIDLSIIDTNELEKIKEKQKRANRVKHIIHENGLDKDKEFMDEINPLIEKLVKD